MLKTCWFDRDFIPKLSDLWWQKSITNFDDIIVSNRTLEVNDNFSFTTKQDSKQATAILFGKTSQK